MSGFFRSSNPALRQNTFSPEQVSGDVMTMTGTVNKAGVLILATAASAAWTWHLYRLGGTDAINPWLWGGVIGGLIAAMVTIFVPRMAPVTAPIYAVLEGLALGGISAQIDAAYPGIAIQAVSLTFGALVVMLVAYQTGLIRATPGFVRGIIIATGSVCLLYIVSMVMGMFGHALPFINGGGTMGIIFSLVVVGIAALNLVLDFAAIEQGARTGAPKYMEWYGAFSLLVTLVWLYMELLRLLSKTRSRQ